jgi:DNA-binding transcriptional regulator YdaS (Cro superfamily)
MNYLVLTDVYQMVDIALTRVCSAAERVKRMKLRDYIKSLDKAQLDAFAAACNTTVGQLKQLAYGRQPSAEMAIAIDRGSRGEVSCESLRPDIDWNYLRGTRHEKQAAA